MLQLNAFLSCQAFVLSLQLGHSLDEGTLVIVHDIGDFIADLELFLPNHLRLHDDFHITTQFIQPLVPVHQAQFHISITTEQVMNLMGQLQHGLALYLGRMGRQDRDHIQMFQNFSRIFSACHQVNGGGQLAQIIFTGIVLVIDFIGQIHIFRNIDEQGKHSKIARNNSQFIIGHGSDNI